MPAPLLFGSLPLTTAVRRALVRRGARPELLDDPFEPPTVHTAAGWDLHLDPIGAPEAADRLRARPTAPVALLAGPWDRQSVRPWEQAVDSTLQLIRLLPGLSGRRVVALTALTALPELPGLTVRPAGRISDRELLDRCDALADLGDDPCPPHLSARWARRLIDGAAADGGVATLIQRANELLLIRAVPAAQLRLLRVGELIGEPGQPRPAGAAEQAVRRIQAGRPPQLPPGEAGFVAVTDLAELVAALLCDEITEPDPAPVPRSDQQISRQLRELAAAEVLALHPPVPVVIPPRPEQPDQVSHRMAAALQTGLLKHGGPWTSRLTDALRENLDLPADRALLLTASGSAALRLAVVALVGPARPGQVAVLPSYTFAATGEILAQLGYGLRFYDVDPDSWTADPASAEQALAAGDAVVLITVDALGNPIDYARMRALADRFAVPLLADSAPSLGALAAGRPIGAQADAHVFSMSFAKVVSAGGAGGALVLPTESLSRLTGPVDWTRSALMPEVNAIAALDQLERLDQLQGRRAAVAGIYTEFLAGLDGVRPQRVRPGDRHAYVHWAARFADPGLARRLAELGIGTRNYYGPVLHRVPWPGPASAGPPLPVTDRLTEEVLALPMSSELTPDVAEQVAAAVRALVIAGPS